MDIIKELDILSENELSELETRLKITPDMRIHTSKYPIYELKKERYYQKSGNKPYGFWYGFGNEWIEWTEMAGPELKGEYVHKVDIDGSNILQIKDYSEIERFTKEYQSNHQIIPGVIFDIDWSRIEFQYDGIEINPYIYQALMSNKFLWYYGWDVASGCIWNLSKVKIILLGLLKYEK